MSSKAPHPIPPGKENMPCPINGMFLSKEAEEAKNDLENDPDIVKEKQHFSEQALVMAPMASNSFIPMQVIHGAHTPSEATRRLVEKVGMEKLRRFTALFYERCFVDRHLDQFIAEHSEPHAERFANWIAEKLGFGTPWTQERRSRPKKFMHFGDETMQVSHDRSTSHFAAWYSPKREAQQMGQKFQPEDARNWMRLHFWAARETGLYDEHPDFMDYYERFIGRKSHGHLREEHRSGAAAAPRGGTDLHRFPARQPLLAIQPGGPAVRLDVASKVFESLKCRLKKQKSPLMVPEEN